MIKASSVSLTKSQVKRQAQKAQKISRHFNFDSLMCKFDEIIATLPDRREGKNISKSMEDATLNAFALFFTQNPSFLSYQKSMQKSKGKNNADSLFGIKNILSDNHIRFLLDKVSPSYLSPMYSFIFDGLEQGGYLNEMRSYNNNQLVAMDGVQYFSSSKIHCENCNETHHKTGGITYSHSAVTPVIVKPGVNIAISLFPEFITPQDGHDKQDCENAAAKRWLRTYGEKFKKKSVTITGDDLYCKQPLCDLIKEIGWDFILVCKEESHKILYEFVRCLGKDIPQVQVRRWTGNRFEVDTYRYFNNIPLRDGKDALQVNWCEIVTRVEKCKDSKANANSKKDDEPEEKIVYENTFITNFEITPENVSMIVADGRTRWKIENENNNVLKTKGYHFEHNFGHGKNHLSSLLATLNILAFLFHTVLELIDERYALLRGHLPTRIAFFTDIVALTRYIYFDNWGKLLDFMIDGLELELPKSFKHPDTG